MTSETYESLEYVGHITKRVYHHACIRNILRFSSGTSAGDAQSQKV